jgi:hypothetical protein
VRRTGPTPFRRNEALSRGAWEEARASSAAALEQGDLTRRVLRRLSQASVLDRLPALELLVRARVRLVSIAAA